MQDKWKTQFAAFLGAFILVIGTAGLVYGSDADDTSGINVTVDAVPAEIEIYNLDIYDADGETNRNIIDEGGEGENWEFDFGEADKIWEIRAEIKVTSDSGFDYVQEANISIYPELPDTNGATAQDDSSEAFFYESWTNFGDNGDPQEGDNVTYRNVTWGDRTEPGSGDDLYPFLRYGDWHVEAQVEDEDETDSDSANNAFFVETFATLETTGTIEGNGAPGETIEDGDWDTKDSFTYSINAAHSWNYLVAEFEHETTDHTIGADNFTAGFSPDGNPVYDRTVNEVDITYTMDIPMGQYPGTYTSEITHQIFNEDAND